MRQSRSKSSTSASEKGYPVALRYSCKNARLRGRVPQHWLTKSARSSTANVTHALFRLMHMGRPSSPTTMFMYLNCPWEVTSFLAAGVFGWKSVVLAHSASSRASHLTKSSGWQAWTATWVPAKSTPVPGRRRRPTSARGAHQPVGILCTFANSLAIAAKSSALKDSAARSAGGRLVTKASRCQPRPAATLLGPSSCAWNAAAASACCSVATRRWTPERLFRLRSHLKVKRPRQDGSPPA
mmetsp:Transcript_141631/g.440296  ORF Transcript_141631/g.440296 Transcript_141631/m.440296 type:complete len:240 (-) Transcript_141631:1241-1960(-)